MTQQPFLLHSLTFYSDLIERLSKLPTNPHIVEIGSEAGEMSVFLARQAQERGGNLFVIEPIPSDQLRELAEQQPNVRVIEQGSPAALDGLPTAGLYVLDGDHNYSVVTGELRDILGRPDSQDSLVVMHDVGWPWGRRDLYYDPDALPPGEVHPHSFNRGVLPGQSELAPPGRGFRSNGAFAVADHEGGPRNGVLTGIEDVLAEHPDRSFLSTPLVFGLGVIGSASSPVWKETIEEMRPYTDDAMALADVERNRIALYLEVIRLTDEAWAVRARRFRRRVGSVTRRFVSSARPPRNPRRQPK